MQGEKMREINKERKIDEKKEREKRNHNKEEIK
jgi:hypothetical protein